MTDTPHVAVTGAAGYIGSRLVADLDDRTDWDLTPLDNFYKGQVRDVAGHAVADVDIRDRDALEATIAGADAVCHLAAISGVDDCEDDPDLAYEVNVQGTENVAWFCRKTGATMVFPFSMAVLGDPVEFPITVDHPRGPLNWYGQTKYISERAIDLFAEGAFPAVQLMISNLYGDHLVGDQRVSKGTVINFFVDRALADEPLTVYAPGTQSRNFVHVDDVARAMALATEFSLERRAAGDTGSWKYEIATDDDPSVHAVAELVRDAVATHAGREVPIEVVENPREGETMVEAFGVDTSAAETDLGWAPERSVAESIDRLVAAQLD